MEIALEMPKSFSVTIFGITDNIPKEWKLFELTFVITSVAKRPESEIFASKLSINRVCSRRNCGACRKVRLELRLLGA